MKRNIVYWSLYHISILFSEKNEVRGEVLDLIRISRTEMGAYLCIARNGVQPAVSKRIILNVDCK